MKYRIVKIEVQNPYFILQTKSLFGWRTWQEKGYDDLGMWSYDRRFKSPEEIEEFISNHITKPKHSIIKEW